MKKKSIATLDAQNALWMAGEFNLGVMPAPRRAKLIRGIRRARGVEAEAVALRYPSLARAVRMADGSTESIEALRTIVKDRADAALNQSEAVAS